MDIPPAWEQSLPQSIKDLLLLEPPHHASIGGNKDPKIEDLFSKDEPSNYEMVLDDPAEIPSSIILSKLQSHVAVANQQGFHSVYLKSPPWAPLAKFPLWAVKYWTAWSVIIVSHQGWSRAKSWLSNNKQDEVKVWNISYFKLFNIAYPSFQQVQQLYFPSTMAFPSFFRAPLLYG